MIEPNKKPTLAVVVPKDTISHRVKALQAEARALAQEHIRAFATALSAAEELASEIAAGGDAYPAGVRDLARRFAEEADARGKTIHTLISRS